VLALVWFSWPITVAVAATFLAVHLYFRATRNDRSVGSGAGLAVLGALSVALPAIPLAVAMSPGCSDTGAATFFTPRWAVVSSLVGLWVAMLAAVYRAAGASFWSSVTWAIGVPLCAGIAAALEYPLSEGLMAAYCNDTMPGVFTIELMVAIVIAGGVAASMAWWMKRHAVSA
jgi:hypothetical protein